MPSFVGRMVDLDRLGRWIDPGLAYLDYRLAFVQVALLGSHAADSAAVLEPTLTFRQVLAGLLSPATLAMVGGAFLVLALGIARSMGSGRAQTAGVPAGKGSRTAMEAAFLLVVLTMLAVLRCSAVDRAPRWDASRTSPTRSDSRSASCC